MFKVIWHPKVRKFLRKISSKDSQRIVKKILEIRKDPFRYLEHYEGDSCYKLRIGDFRALIDVDLKEKNLHVRVLDKRGRIYKR